MARWIKHRCDWCGGRAEFTHQMTDVYFGGKKARVHKGTCVEQLGKEAIAAANENRPMRPPAVRLEEIK